MYYSMLAMNWWHNDFPMYNINSFTINSYFEKVNSILYKTIYIIFIK